MREGSFSAVQFISEKCELTNQEQAAIDFSCQRAIDPITGLLSLQLNWSYEYNPLIEIDEVVSQKNIYLESRRNGQSVAIGGNIGLNPEVYTYTHAEMHTAGHT